jgi:hypothetical protein
VLLGSPLDSYQVSVRFSFQGPRQRLLASSFDWAVSALGSRTLGPLRRLVNSFLEMLSLFWRPPKDRLSSGLLWLRVPSDSVGQICRRVSLGGRVTYPLRVRRSTHFRRWSSFFSPVQASADRILNMRTRSYLRETIVVLTLDSFRAAEDILCGATGQSLCGEWRSFFCGAFAWVRGRRSPSSPWGSGCSHRVPSGGLRQKRSDCERFAFVCPSGRRHSPQIPPRPERLSVLRFAARGTRYLPTGPASSKRKMTRDHTFI